MTLGRFNQKQLFCHLYLTCLGEEGTEYQISHMGVALGSRKI